MRRFFVISVALLVLLSGCSESAFPSEPTSFTDNSSTWGENFFGEALIEAPCSDAELLSPSEKEAAVISNTALLEEDVPVIFDDLTEDDIFSYLQGNGSYDKGLDWAGDWCYIDAGEGRMFYSFGCGLCCLANMYSTLTADVCTPGEMYELAKEQTGYSPGPDGGAIDWPYIDQICRLYGFGGTLCAKPDDYAQFQQDMASAITIMVLVSSYEDDAIWQDLPGHYVNLWLYDADTDTVFMSDSRAPSTNRTRVALSDVYNALLTSNPYQYYLIR